MLKDWCSTLDKKLIELSERISEHLGIDPVPIKFEDIEPDDSRLCIKGLYISINNKYKDDYLECAKCIAHELRHVFQMFYVQVFSDERAKRWKEELAHQINSSNMDSDGKNYLAQELELDAFAFTKYYLKEYESI